MSRVMGPRARMGAVGAGMAIVLSACGSTPAPGGPGAVGPLRPVTSQRVAADGGLECPATVTDQDGMTVPQLPQGVDGLARLVPEREPTSLVVCSYPVLDIMSGPLASPYALDKRTLASAGQRSDVTELLTWAPRDNGGSKACTAMGGNETVHLVGGRYADAIVWVAAKADPNSCSKATNGDFVSSAALGVTLDAMFGDREPAPTPTDPCAGWGQGRLGDDESLAPPGDPKVTVCRTRTDGSNQATALSAERSREVVNVLRGLDVRRSDHGCTNSGDDWSRQFRLVLRYGQGPPVWLSVSPTCAPEVFGWGLAADDAGGLVELVERWSPPIPGPDPNGSVSSS